MSEVQVDVVRVFTDEHERFGNELGIVSASEASDGREQAIAAGLGFSETVFLAPLRGDRQAMRIFTPAAELPFAGHPSVGTAWWLARQGTPIATLELAAGDVAVRYDGDLTWITGRASWAPEFEWMPLPTPAEVDALDRTAFLDGRHYAYAWIDERGGILRSRMFAPLMGIAEDEATGAAAVAITTKLDRDLEIHQGNGSRLRTRRLAGGLVEVGGRVAYEQRLTV
jgi:predicted PhzF superfamily epimerase YddE/YHI9